MASLESGKKRKKSKKVVEVELVDPILKSPSKSPKKQKLMTIKQKEKDLDEDNNHKTTSSFSPDGKVLDWPPEDLTTLVNNLAKSLPKNDISKYSTLTEKLDWEKVAFSKYSAIDCKNKWIQISSRLRRYRTLTDMVIDAREWLKTPWQTYNNSKKVKHPDLPKKPLTPFFRYFMEKREKMGESNPGKSVTDLAKILSVKFAALSDKKKQKYKDQYEEAFEEYKEKLEAFKILHPELNIGLSKAHSHATGGQAGPAKPKTPYQLFSESKLKHQNLTTPEEKKQAIEKVKNSWHKLSEGKKIKWIRRSLMDVTRYETELLEFIKDHPNFEGPKIKSILSKAEKELKDKFDGKPEKPPNSGYSLFSKILLRELKDIPSKEKMVVIAKRWKELGEKEREEYNQDAQKAMSKFVERFETYINQLPEEERAKVMSENKVKLPNKNKLKMKAEK